MAALPFKGKQKESNFTQKVLGDRKGNSVHWTNECGGDEYAYVGAKEPPTATVNRAGNPYDQTQTANPHGHLEENTEEEDGNDAHNYEHDSWAAYYSEPNNQWTYMITDTTDRYAFHESQWRIEKNEGSIPILVDSGASRTVVGRRWLQKRCPDLVITSEKSQRTFRFATRPNRKRMGMAILPFRQRGFSSKGKTELCLPCTDRNCGFGRPSFDL